MPEAKFGPDQLETVAVHKEQSNRLTHISSISDSYVTKIHKQCRVQNVS